MSNKGLKAGDTILYQNGVYNFIATVIAVPSTTKAVIKAHTYTDVVFNPHTQVNTYRKYMHIVPPKVK